jgi:PAS domain-containing protein
VDPFSSDLEDVRAYLASSNELVHRLAKHIEQTKARVATAKAHMRGAGTVSARFARRLEEIRASLVEARGYEPTAPAPSNTEEEPSADLYLGDALLAMSEALETACKHLHLGRRLLEREHAKYMAASESDPTPILITDATTTVRDANPAAASKLGIELRNLSGRLLVTFVARPDVDRFCAFTRKLEKGLVGRERSLTVRIRPRGRASERTRLSVRSVRSVRQASIGLRWTLESARDERVVSRRARRS